jgi:endonuclease YncB( thermonuclease family)
VIRIAGLFLTVGLISVIASGLLPSLGDVRDRFDSPESTPNSVAQIDVPTRTPLPAPTPMTTAAPADEAGPSSSDPKDPTAVPLETAVALGVGSDQPSETPTNTPEPTATATEEPVEVAQATEEPTEIGQETTESEPTATEEEAAEPESADTETEDATEPEGEASGALQDQGATLESNEVPAQTFDLNGLRVQISGAYRAGSLPDLTLGRSTAGEWVVLLLDAVNWSAEPADLDMTGFRLAPAADLSAEIPLDPSTGAVATFLDVSQALRATESAAVPPGGYQPIVLVFSIPAGLDSPVLLAGEQAIALDRSFEHQSSGQLEGSGFTAPELVTGTVVEVIDGQTVNVDIEGETTTVRYYGLQPLDAGGCYTEESAAANASLVEGQTLLFERERRNRSETTTYLRDAWLVDESGDRHLVAASLVAEGAAVPEPSDPDIRYAGWLAGKALLAESAGAGLWSVC